jgi:hypothetical protein
MKRRRPTKQRAKQLGHSFSKLTRELTITIRYKLFAKTMVAENIVYAEVCKSSRKQFFFAGHEVYHLRQLVNKDTDRVMAPGRYC